MRDVIYWPDSKGCIPLIADQIHFQGPGILIATAHRDCCTLHPQNLEPVLPRTGTPCGFFFVAQDYILSQGTNPPKAWDNK